jgi:hypothetical protein
VDQPSDRFDRSHPAAQRNIQQTREKDLSKPLHSGNRLAELQRHVAWKPTPRTSCPPHRRSGFQPRFNQSRHSRFRSGIQQNKPPTCYALRLKSRANICQVDLRRLALKHTPTVVRKSIFRVSFAPMLPASGLPGYTFRVISAFSTSFPRKRESRETRNLLPPAVRAASSRDFTRSCHSCGGRNPFRWAVNPFERGSPRESPLSALRRGGQGV